MTPGFGATLASVMPRALKRLIIFAMPAMTKRCVHQLVRSPGRRVEGIPSNRRTDSRPMPGHRIDKTVAGVGMALPARFQHVAQQEQAGERKTVLQVLVGPAVHAAFSMTDFLAQEWRQP